MSYICIECGAEFGYEDLLRTKMKCNQCTIKRNNIWVKQRPKDISKIVIAR